VTISIDPSGRTLLAGSVRLPVVETESEDWPFDGGRMRTRRAVIACENGWLISVVWGSGTYSGNGPTLLRPAEDTFTEEPETVEVGVLVPGGGLLRGDVMGWVAAPGLAAIAEVVGGLPSSTDQIDLDALALLLNVEAKRVR